MVKLYSILGNSQRLDGGAMFGNVPKALWEKWCPPDENNTIPLNCRALLIQDPDRNILLETGIGAFFEPKLKQRYGVVEDEHMLLKNLQKHNLTDQDIDIIILSHLHFDHAGGLLAPWAEGQPHKLLFPNAKFIVSDIAWQRANNPHARDKASFIPKLNKLLADSNRLELVNSTTCALLGENYKFHYSNGHTPGMLLTEIATNDGPLVFAADLIPGKPWIHLPITMGYDRYPELVIDEKKKLLTYLADNNGRIFYTHDSECDISGISRDDKGRFTCKSSD